MLCLLVMIVKVRKLLFVLIKVKIKKVFVIVLCFGFVRIKLNGIKE